MLVQKILFVNRNLHFYPSPSLTSPSLSSLPFYPSPLSPLPFYSSLSLTTPFLPLPTPSLTSPFLPLPTIFHLLPLQLSLSISPLSSFHSSSPYPSTSLPSFSSVLVLFIFMSCTFVFVFTG